MPRVPIRIRPRLLLGLAVLPPVGFWALISARPHSGRVETLHDFFLLESQKGWQALLLAVCLGVGPLAAAAVGTVLGVEVSGRPRATGELSYLRISGPAMFRKVMCTRFGFALASTVLWVLLLALSSFVVGIVAFGSGSFTTPGGTPLSDGAVTAIVTRCVISICCIGAVSCAVATVIGSRFSVQAALVCGMSLPFLRQAVGSLPGLQQVFEYTPIGNYYGWTRRMIAATEQGTETALHVTTALRVVLAFALAASTWWFVAPRVGST